MFTGLVEEVGTVVSVRRSGQSVALAIRAVSFAHELAVGDSVCVSGVCLTATAIRTDGTFTADVTPETFSRSSFAELVPGKKVNLERPKVLYNSKTKKFVMWVHYENGND